MARITLVQLAERLNANCFQISGIEDNNALADAIMGVASSELAEWHATLGEQQKRNFFFVLSRVGDLETFTSLSKKLIVRPILEKELVEMEAEADKRNVEIRCQNLDLQDEIRTLREQVAGLKEANKSAWVAFERSESNAARLQVELESAKVNADKWVKFKEMLAS